MSDEFECVISNVISSNNDLVSVIYSIYEQAVWTVDLMKYLCEAKTLEVSQFKYHLAEKA